MSESKFKIGDVVILKSGGPPMTIHGIGDYTMSAGIDPGIFCIWFHGSDRKSEVFHPDSLEIYNPAVESVQFQPRGF